jgi:L-threonylcarbamoyladenylate synthase
MLDRHYAPKARLLLIQSITDPAAVAAVAEARLIGGRIGALTRGLLLEEAELQEQLPLEPAGYARELYGALHRMDEAGAALILVERPPDDPQWDAVRDRLVRASRP